MAISLCSLLETMNQEQLKGLLETVSVSIAYITLFVGTWKNITSFLVLIAMLSD